MQKYILVTASTKGLGLEIAKQLSFSGYNIILTSRSEKNLQKAKLSLNQTLNHKTIKIDFTKNKCIEKLIHKIENYNIEAIIHNFGLNLENDSHDIDINILFKSIQYNFANAVEINNQLYKKLKGNPSKIIHIGSTASLHAKASPSYTLSKSLLNTYVKNISKHYAQNNISICTVLPGILAHKNSQWDIKKKIDPQKYKDTQQNQPLGKFSLPEDIAPYIVDLVKQKSFMHTGTTIKLDANDY